MSWLHTWSGLVLGWLLFAIYVTGTLAFFRNEITFWMQPELHKADSRTLALDRALQTLEQKAADATQWTITLPSPRNPTLGLSWQSATGRGEGQPEGARPEGMRPGEQDAEGATFERGREGGGQARRERAERTANGEQAATTARERPAGREGRPEGARPEGRGAEGATFERAREGGGQARRERAERTANGEQAATTARERPAGRDGRPEGARPEGTRPEGARPERARPGGRGAEGATFDRAREGGEQTREERSERGERMANGERAAPSTQGSQSAQRQQGGGGGGGGRGPRILLDPATGEVLQGRTTAGGNFLYRFHFELYGMDRTWARWIVGIATLLMFAALISGVIVHRNIFKDFFTFRPAKGKRSWLDAHNASSVMSLPFHIVITFSGLLLFGNMMIPTAMQSVYHDDRDAYMQDMRGRMMMTTPTPPSGERAPLTDLGPLLAVAEQTWQNRGIGSITITNPGDRNAIVDIRQTMAGGSLAAGRNMADSLRFDGVSGAQLDSPAIVPVSAVQSISNTLIMLHRGFFASPMVRWLLFLAGVGGSIMIATGLVMWVVARAKDQEKASRAVRFGHRLVEVLNVAGVAGLLVAIGAYFWASRLIPADLPDRSALEIEVFFYGWLIAFIYALIRRHKAAWIEELACAGLLIALLPFVNALTGGLSLFGSIYLDQWLLAGFDLCALAIGIGLLFAARKVYLHVPRVRPEKTAPETEGAAAGKSANAAPEAVRDLHDDEEATPSALSFNNLLQAGENA
jgi:uncharacterized iron-regulated membrane protein